MNILKYQDFVNEEKSKFLSQKTKKELLDWMASPTKGSISDQATSEILSDPTLRPNTRIKLYRGLLFQKGRVPSITGNTLEIKDDNFSSWTTSEVVARRFARFNKVGTGYDIVDAFIVTTRDGKIDGELGVVISKEFDPDDILIDTSKIKNKMSTKFKTEDEVIVKPFSSECDIVKVFTKRNEYSPKEFLELDRENGYEMIKEYLKSAAKEVDVTLINKTSKELSSLHGMLGGVDHAVAKTYTHNSKR